VSEQVIEAFAAAGKAVEAGDWLGLFRRLTPASLSRVAANTVLFLIREPELRAETLALLEERGEPTAPVEAVLELQERMLVSAQAIAANTSDAVAMMEVSSKHRLLVKEHEKAQKAIVKSWKDRSATAAALEALMCARSDSGSVSSTLFVAETLSGLEVGDNRARAVRVARGQEIAPVSFERRRDGWLIHLFAK